MYVILDWVANHTAWDNPLVTSHPDWYVRDYKGDSRPPRGGTGTTSSTWTTARPSSAVT